MNAGLDLKISFYLLFLNRTSRCREEDEDEETTTVIRTTIAVRSVARTVTDRDRDRDIRDRDLSGEGYKEFLNWSKTKDGK